MEKSKVWLSPPHMCGLEETYVKEAFDTNWVAPLGHNLDALEAAISLTISRSGDFHTIGLISGTAALHLAFRMLDIGVGDVVMLQSFTFCGSAFPVSYQGAELVFIDSELDTWNMCPVALEQALFDHRDRRVKAIVPVHIYGMPAKMDEIQALAEKFGVPIVEDAAEALGSTYRDAACGSFGLLSALSFNGNKIITTSGGGALLSKNKEYIDQARFLATQARDNYPYYQHSQIGYNYQMSNIVAGVGLGQIEVLAQRVAQRRANNQRYRKFFAGIEGVTFQTEPSEDYFSNYWLSAVVIDPSKTGGITRSDVRLALEMENIESRPLWYPMHMQPVYLGSKFYGTGVCERLFADGLCFPSGSNLRDEDFGRIFSVLSEVFRTRL